MEIKHCYSTDRMSSIVTHNNTIYLCGQVADSADWDIREQTQRCLGQIDELLSDVDSNRNRILSTTIYIRDMKDFAAMNEVWDAWVAEGEKPARACVEARMATDTILVEFSVIAAL